MFYVGDIFALRQADVERIGMSADSCEKIPLVLESKIVNFLSILYKMNVEGVAIPISVKIRISASKSDIKQDPLKWYVLVCHELVHIRQIRRKRKAKFSILYVSDFVKSFVRKRGFDAAYLSIRFEEEAYRIQNNIKESLMGEVKDFKKLVNC